MGCSPPPCNRSPPPGPPPGRSTHAWLGREQHPAPLRVTQGHLPAAALLLSRRGAAPGRRWKGGRSSSGQTPRGQDLGEWASGERGMCALPGIFICSLHKGVGEPPRSPLCAHREGERRQQGSAPGCSPAPLRGGVRPGPASLPPTSCPHGGPGGGFSIPNHGRGVKGNGGGEGALGAMEHSPRSLPELGTWSPAPCGAGATGCETDGDRGHGEAAGGSPGVPSTQPVRQDPALPRRWPWACCPMAAGAAGWCPREKDAPFWAGLSPPHHGTGHPRAQTHPAPLGGDCG